MFKDMFKGLLAGVALKLLANYQQLSLCWLKIETAKSCVHGVRLARLSALTLLQLCALLALICLGVLLLHVGLFVLLPWSLTAKAVLGMSLGLLYILGGCLALRAAMDEKIWLEKSGVTALLKEITAPPCGD